MECGSSCGSSCGRRTIKLLIELEAAQLDLRVAHRRERLERAEELISWVPSLHSEVLSERRQLHGQHDLDRVQSRMLDVDLGCLGPFASDAVGAAVIASVDNPRRFDDTHQPFDVRDHGERKTADSCNSILLDLKAQGRDGHVAVFDEDDLQPRRCVARTMSTGRYRST
eukprot:605192-Prymnesium_polylepis.1